MLQPSLWAPPIQGTHFRWTPPHYTSGITSVSRTQPEPRRGSPNPKSTGRPLPGATSASASHGGRRRGIRGDDGGSSDSHLEQWTSVEARGKGLSITLSLTVFQPSKFLSKNAISGSKLKGTTTSFIVSTPTEHQRSIARRSTGGVAYSGATRGAERSRCKCRSRRPTEACLVGPTYVLKVCSFICM